MSEHSSSLAVLLKRLEAATSRLEGLASTKPKTGFVPDQPAPSTTTSSTIPSAPVSSTTPAFLNDYQTLVQPALSNFLSLSSTLSPLISNQSLLISQLFDLHLNFLKISLKAKKPKSDEELLSLWKPLQTKLDELIKLKESNRGHEHYNHLSVVADGAPAVSWLVVESDRSAHVKEFLDSAQFFANRVIKQFKETDKSHVAWCNSFMDLLKQLQKFVSTHFKSGLNWNANGIDADKVELDSNVTNKVSPGPVPPPKPLNLRSNSNSSVPSSGGPPPPPPAPLPSTLLNERDGGKESGSDKGNLFSEINQGSDITSKLKKVDNSMMTHKNPELKATSPVVKPPAKSTARPGIKANVPAKDPETKLEGQKWFIQNYTSGSVEVTPTELKQVVYIYNCNNITVQVNGKCSAVVLDTCKKTGVVIQTAMASVDIINSSSCQFQIINTTPTVVIDKTDGLQLYLSKQCLDIEITTAKSSQINILIPEDNDEDFVEKALPEQFKSKIVDGKVITVPVEHD